MPVRHHHFYKTQEGDDNTLILMPVWNNEYMGNLTYGRKEKDIYLFGYMIISNLHLVVQHKEEKLPD